MPATTAAIASLKNIKLLTVAVDRLKRWYNAGMTLVESLVAMGMWLIDNGNLEELAAVIRTLAATAALSTPAASISARASRRDRVHRSETMAKGSS